MADVYVLQKLRVVWVYGCVFSEEACLFIDEVLQFAYVFVEDGVVEVDEFFAVDAFDEVEVDLLDHDEVAAVDAEGGFAVVLELMFGCLF